MSQDDITVSEESLDLASYRQLLEKALSESLSQMIPNSGSQHAAIMMSSMFDATKREFCLVVNNFDGKVSDNHFYLDSLRNCLAKSEVTGKVLLLQQPNKNSQTFKLLTKWASEEQSKVKIKMSNNDCLSIIKQEISGQNDEVVNWSTYDENHFRLEINPKKYSAIGGINQKIFTNKLKGIFNKVFIMANDYIADNVEA